MSAEPARIASLPVPMTAAKVKAERDAIEGANPGWTVSAGRNGMWHAKSRGREAHGGSPDELRQSIRAAKRGTLP